MSFISRLLTILIVVICFLSICMGGDYALEDVINSQCNGGRKKDCIVKLKEENYTLSKKIDLHGKYMHKLAIIGKGYGTRIMCNYNFTDEGNGNKKNALLSIHHFDEVYIKQLHFHNCHPAKVVPLMNEHNCAKNTRTNSKCPKHPGKIKRGKHHQVVSEEFTFENNTVYNRPRKEKAEFMYTSVNATIWVKNCNKVTIDYCSFNNFSFNAVQVTDTINTNISSLFLYKSTYFYKGYQARGVLYEIFRDDKKENLKLNIEHSFFEDIATLTENAEFNINISENHTLKDIEGHYGGAGIKILILADVRVDIEIRKCYFRRCTALQGGGILLATTDNQLGYNLTIDDSVFEWNQALFQTYLNPSGGAILIKQRANNTYIQIHNCWFRNNCANRGGAIGIDINAKSEKSVRFKSQNNTFHCNSANRGAGGAVYIENSLGIENSFHFDKSNFTNNSAENGGAIFAFNSYINLADSNLHSNRGKLGGAMVLTSSKLFFTGLVSIQDNVADLRGGGLYLTAYSKIHVKANAFVLVKGNKAFYKGGGIYVFNNYQENKYMSWLTHIDQLKGVFCFITIESKNYSLEFSENHIKNVNNQRSEIIKPTPCRGSNLFVHTWGACWSSSRHEPTLVMTNTTNLYGNDTCSVATGIAKYKKIDLKDTSLCYFNTHDRKLKPHCQSKLIDANSFPGYMNTMQKEVRKAIESFEHQMRVPHEVYVIYPGFETAIAIESRDESDKAVVTDTVILFEQISSAKKQQVNFKFGRFNKIEADKIVSPSSRWVNFSLITNEDNWVHGKLCLKSKLSLRDITYCVPIILARCMPGFTLQQNQCKPILYYSTRNGGTYVTLKKNHMMVVLRDDTDNETDIIRYIRCAWFQCNCANSGGCTFNALKPEEQCLPGLNGRFCTQGEYRNETVAPFYSIYNTFTNKTSFECPAPWPWLTLIFYFVICAVILLVIIMLQIDIFEDYTRSIIFYSGILFIMTISCELSEDDLFHRVITVPIVILNLEITHMYPFCFFKETTGLDQAVFELYAPLVFAFYIFVIYLCIRYFSGTWLMIRLKLGKKDILRQFWTILILLYTNLCGGAFLIFSCPLDDKQVRRWLINGDIKCFVGDHMKTVIAAIFPLYILSIVPIILIFISKTKINNMIHIVWIYEKRYKRKYKHWEVMKLVLRFVLGFTLIIPEKHIDYPCIVVSTVCLVLMALTSILQPSENQLANHFESFCLLILAFVGIQNNKITSLFNLLITSPYIIFIIIRSFQPIIKCTSKIIHKVKLHREK